MLQTAVNAIPIPPLLTCVPFAFLFILLAISVAFLFYKADDSHRRDHSGRGGDTSGTKLLSANNVPMTSKVAAITHHVVSAAPAVAVATAASKSTHKSTAETLHFCEEKQSDMNSTTAAPMPPTPTQSPFSAPSAIVAQPPRRRKKSRANQRAHNAIAPSAVSVVKTSAADFSASPSLTPPHSPYSEQKPSASSYRNSKHHRIAQSNAHADLADVNKLEPAQSHERWQRNSRAASVHPTMNGTTAETLLPTKPTHSQSTSTHLQLQSTSSQTDDFPPLTKPPQPQRKGKQQQRAQSKAEQLESGSTVSTASPTPSTPTPSLSPTSPAVSDISASLTLGDAPIDVSQHKRRRGRHTRRDRSAVCERIHYKRNS